MRYSLLLLSVVETVGRGDKTAELTRGSRSHNEMHRRGALDMSDARDHSDVSNGPMGRQKTQTHIYKCTFPHCHKRFADRELWKRHENSQHVQLDVYRCPCPASVHGRHGVGSNADYEEDGRGAASSDGTQQDSSGSTAADADADAVCSAFAPSPDVFCLHLAEAHGVAPMAWTASSACASSTPPLSALSAPWGTASAVSSTWPPASPSSPMASAMATLSPDAAPQAGFRAVVDGKEHAMAACGGKLVQLQGARLGRNHQGQFWCCFCRAVVALRTRRNEAWDERFAHLEQHFVAVMGGKGLRSLT